MQIGQLRNMNRKQDMLSRAYSTTSRVVEERLSAASQPEAENCRQEVQAIAASLRLRINLS